ncbi:Acyltransferase-like protein At1g54570 [Durusdinium trenchii]
MAVVGVWRAEVPIVSDVLRSSDLAGSNAPRSQRLMPLKRQLAATAATVAALAWPMRSTRHGRKVRLQAAGLATPGTADAVGPVRFELVGGPDDASGDVLLYLPDIDFQSSSIPSSQYPNLVAAGFELWSCSLAEDDVKTGFAELLRSIEMWLRRKGSQRVVLIGEGFGGLLALALAFRTGRSLKGLMMVNPATGLVQQPWRQLRPGLPVVPLSELLALAPETATVSEAITGTLGLRSASAAARAGTLQFRLKAWLRDGWELVSSELRRPPERNPLPATVLAFSDDVLLPSKDEGNMLKPALQERCLINRLQVKELESKSHEPLVGDIDLVAILKESPIFQAPKDPVSDFKFPSMAELEEGSKDVERLASVVSPVFCSFSAASPSQRVFGLEGVPTPADVGERPVLLVGNHQLAGADLGPLVREFLVDRGVLTRGLAYPGAMRTREGQGPPQFQRFGAVPVSPRNIFKLLQQGEMVLLFPGGIREALHGPGEEYQLFWPNKTDFVRVAARFNAVVVPFGGIGADDSAQVLANLGDLRQQAEKVVPWMARSQKRSGGLMPVSESLEGGLGFPLIAPKVSSSLFATESESGFGDRFYFSFGKPFDLKEVNPKDRDACAQVYSNIRAAVEQEMAWLQKAREQDPYRDFVKRQLYERVAALEGPVRRIPDGPLEGELVQSYAKRAPSFDLNLVPPLTVRPEPAIEP